MLQHALYKHKHALSKNVTLHTNGWKLKRQTKGNAITVDGWPEANVEQQYRKGPDCLVHQMLTVLATINPEKSLLWDLDLGPSSSSRTYA